MIRKYAFVIANSIIIILIIGVYFGLQLSEITFYKEMATNQAENDVQLTAIDISSTLSRDITEQLVVSKMMAHDLFLRTWCNEETGETAGENVYQLYSYLGQYRADYNYDIVFFVSDATKNYYYNGGFNKVIDENDDFDSWYFNFLDLRQHYDIQVDYDEINDQTSIFVNCLVQDKGFKTLGVVGVGNNIDEFQKKISKYEEEYGVKICVVKVGDSHNSFNGSGGYYKNPEDAAELMGLSVEDVTRSVGDEGYTWFEDNKCTNIQHNKDLDWNIIVQMDVTPTIDSIMYRTQKRVGVVIVLILFYTLISFTLMARLSSISRKVENTDELTGLYNNKIFKEMFAKHRKRFKNKEVSLFMLDVDDFKIFNDSYGHLYGNTVLKMVADSLKECIGKDGIAARWGGDEFIGVIFASPQEAKQMLDCVADRIKAMETHRPITCSIGVAKVDFHMNLENNIARADEALYVSKEKGKSQCNIYR